MTTMDSKAPVINYYHGEKVVDEFQWLEKTDTKEVEDWIQMQNKRTDEYMSDLKDIQLRIGKELEERYLRKPVYIASFTVIHDRVFYARKDPNQKQYCILSSEVKDGKNVIIACDPASEAVDSTGQTSIDWFAPSPDGKRVAVSLSKNGSEEGSLHVFDAATGELLKDEPIIPRVQFPTGSGHVSWHPDSSGFWYTRYPEDSRFHQQVYYHGLTVVDQVQEKDQYVIGKDFPRIAENRLFANKDGLLVQCANGDGGEFAHFWLPHPTEQEKKKEIQLTRFDSQISKVQYHAGRKEFFGLYAKKQIVLVPSGKVVIAEQKETIAQFLLTSKLIYVVYSLGGPEEIRVFNYDGIQESVSCTLPEPVASIGQLARVATNKDDIFFSASTYVCPPQIFYFDPEEKNGKVIVAPWTPERRQTEKETEKEVLQVFAKSKDGTRVPIRIVKKKGVALNTSSPMLLYGYGGYGISMTPRYIFWVDLWVAHGGVYVESCIRGGGEFGAKWHEEGMLTKKQNCFDDFAACASYLLNRGYTSTDRLAIMGHSNGGLLMGAMITQHPDLFQAVVSGVGIYDMLRVELSSNGEFNITEFGSVKDKQQFDALYAYSPYHHIVEGKRFPAVFLTTGKHDGRVEPSQSYKMCAKLQAANSNTVTLLRVDSNAGHGMGTSTRSYLNQLAETISFLCHQLKMAV